MSRAGCGVLCADCRLLALGGGVAGEVPRTEMMLARLLHLEKTRKEEAASKEKPWERLKDRKIGKHGNLTVYKLPEKNGKIDYGGFLSINKKPEVEGFVEATLPLLILKAEEHYQKKYPEHVIVSADLTFSPQTRL